ncbi:MAG TPA: copper resistance protein CopC, partial [Acidimicrobiales bacterium]|nr:copper resistance protein CopC [Acidimicrobiales bacterium]
MRPLVAGALLAVGALVAAASPAAAHAELQETEPAGGSVLPRPPAGVALRFSEPVEVSFGSIRVFDQDGERLDAGRPRHPDRRSDAVELELPVLDDGAYVVTWRVLSADSHPVRGAFTFRVGPAAAGAEDTRALAQRLLNAQGGSTSVAAVYGVVRFAVFAALVLLVGGTAFALALWPAGLGDRRVRRLLGAAWLVLVGGTAVGIGLQGAYGGGLALADAFRPSVFEAVLDTRFGRVWAARLALLAVAAALLALLARRPRPRRAVVAAALVGVGLLATPGVAGHAATGSLVPLAVAADVVHLGAVAFWLGGLAVLVIAVLRPGDPDTMERVVPRFSRAAFVAVVVILATGTLQGWRQAGSADALTSTTYGRLLLTKVALFAAMVGLGAMSRSWVRRRYLSPQLAASPGPGAVAATQGAGGLRRLRRSVAAEAAVAVVVLAVTSLLVNAVPAKVALAKPYSAELVADDLLFEVTVDPAKAGPLDLHVYALTPAGTVRDVEEITASLSLPAKDVGPITAPLHRAGPGHF